jgi:hypothetical protein
VNSRYDEQAVSSVKTALLRTPVVPASRAMTQVG